MEKLKKEGWDVYFLATPDNYEKILIKKGFKFISLYMNRKGKNLISDLGLLLNFCSIYKKHKFDVVMHYTIKPNIYGSIAAGLLRTKAINTMTGLGYIFMEENLLSKFVKLLYRFAFIFPSRVLFQNKEDLQLFLKNGLVKSSKTLVVPGSGVDVDYFHPQKVKRDTKLDLIFLFAGRLLWDKGLGELVEAFKLVKKAHPQSELWLLGAIDKGNPSSLLENTIRSWEQDGIVKYLGEVVDVRSFIAQCDIAVYPSYREGIPRFMLEAMSMGKPIITTDSVGCREVIENGKNGFMVKPKDVNSLTEAMLRVIELPEQERIVMGEYGREKAMREFAEEKVIAIYLETIRAVTE